MATRRLEGEGWDEAVSRLESWRPEELAVCWAMVRESRKEPWTMLGITVRGGTKVPDRDYEYAKLKLVSCMQRGADVASGLRTGHLPRPPGERQFRQIGATEGIAYWLTSGAV